MKVKVRTVILAAFCLLAIGYLFAQTKSNSPTPRVPAQDASAIAPSPTPSPVAAPTQTPVAAPIEKSAPPKEVAETKRVVLTPHLDPVLKFEEPTVTPIQPAPKPMIAAPSRSPTPPTPTSESKPVVKSDEDDGGVHVYGGLGFNYYQFSENLNTSVATYRSLMTPSYHLGVDLDITKKTAIELEYKDTAVKFNNSSVNLNSGQGHWQTLSLQMSTAIDTISDFLSRVVGDTLEFRLLFGFEAHKMPVALFNNVNTPEIKNLNLIDAELGAHATYFVNPKTKLTIFERIQYPIAVSAEDAGASMSATPIVFFDGSVGVDRKIRENAWLGIYWFGQYNDMRFSYVDSQTNANGSMSSFFSTIELRLTLDF